MVLTPNDLFSWNNKHSKYTIILSHIYTVIRICSPSPSYAHHLLCACWHSEAVMGSSSLSSRLLLISLWVTSLLFLCPELTDAPYLYYGGSVPPFPTWRPHSQGPHTLPFQGTRQCPSSHTTLYTPIHTLHRSHTFHLMKVKCSTL
jgi:hypothetical protein